MQHRVLRKLFAVEGRRHSASRTARAYISAGGNTASNLRPIKSSPVNLPGVPSHLESISRLLERTHCKTHGEQCRTLDGACSCMLRSSQCLETTSQTPTRHLLHAFSFHTSLGQPPPDRRPETPPPLSIHCPCAVDLLCSAKPTTETHAPSRTVCTGDAELCLRFRSASATRAQPPSKKDNPFAGAFAHVFVLLLCALSESDLRLKIVNPCV
eukprot:401374-Rhodomonas_salina.1